MTGPDRSLDDLWLTAAQLAELRLAGLPTTRTGVQKRADAENWRWKERTARGGGRLYHALGLPPAAQADYLARRRDEADAPARRGRPAGTGWFDRNPEAARAIEGLIADQKVSSRNLRKLLAALGFVDLPTARTIRNFVAQLEARNHVVFTALRDPDRYKSMFRPALGRMDASTTFAHEMWEIDTTKADVLCTDGRKNVLGIIDRWSRRARFLVVESESAQSVRRMLVGTIAAWGVMPVTLKVDNGSGFINASVTSALDLLGIALDPCLPGTPEDKPHVERLFGTFTRERASLLPGFAGHSVADAQKLRARAKKKTGRAEVVAGISSQQLQAVLDAWVDGEYHQRTHSGIRMAPMEKWQRSPIPARRAPDAGVLRMALSAYVGTGTVTKRGVRWKGGRYWSPLLVGWMGRQVTIRRDEDDLGALFLFDDQGNYIDTAVNAMRSGLTEQQFALAARAQMAAHLNAAKADIRRIQRDYRPEHAVDQMLRAEAEAAGRLHHLPGHTAPWSTPAIASLTGNEAPRAAGLQSPAAPEATATAPTPTPIDVPGQPVTESVEQKVARHDAVIAAHARGEDVDPHALLLARNYVATPEYRTAKMLSAAFGDGAAANVIPLHQAVA